MRKAKPKIPSYIAGCLWSYDIATINIKADKELIITQVLNYGDWKALKWLYKVYPESQIKQVIKHPQRGLWIKQVLNFWLTMFKIKLPFQVKQRAIFRLEPGFKERATRQFRRG